MLTMQEKKVYQKKINDRCMHNLLMASDERHNERIREDAKRIEDAKKKRKKSNALLKENRKAEREIDDMLYM